MTAHPQNPPVFQNDWQKSMPTREQTEPEPLLEPGFEQCCTRYSMGWENKGCYIHVYIQVQWHRTFLGELRGC